MRKDFTARKFYAHHGSNFYLDRQALVFNLFIDPDGPMIDTYRDEVLERLPQLAADFPDRVAELFARVLIQISKMDIDLYVDRYAISRDGDDYVIAVQYLDEYVSEDAVHFVCDWFRAMNNRERFDFDGKFAELQKVFDGTLFGGPTIYSLIEAGLKRDIPVHFLRDENEFQWGYGKKAVRGRSTTFHVDSIKDTEFTMFKDMFGDFLNTCGFPTPTGKNCFSEKEAIAVAEELGFPLVVKPVAGHKGQGVTTGIEAMDGVSKAYRNIVDGAREEGISFDGALVQQQIFGTDHRLLAVGGKFVAALERVPAYVDGNGRDSIEQLIAVENDTVVRLDNARSPLCKIKIDEDLLDYLSLQELSLSSVPKDGERVELRRVANISQGGVSINVTEKIHPQNVKMVEDIARFFDLTCLGIDVLAKDIGRPWTEGNFGIIEVNAGPGVFMHLAPALGGSIDVPGKIMRSFFPEPGHERVPIIAGNCLSLEFCQSLYEKLRAIRPDLEFGSLTDEGIHFNGEYFYKNPAHWQNVQIILRHPGLDFAVFKHDKDGIFDDGIYHQGADVVILADPHEAEEIMKRDLLPGGYFIAVQDDAAVVYRKDEQIGSVDIAGAGSRDAALLAVLEPLLVELAVKYE